MNLPNILTISRIILGFIIPYLMLTRDFNLQILACFIFAFGAFTDWFDGWYARKYDLVTKLGKILDPLADKIIVIGGFWVFSDFGGLDMYSIWWIVPIALREIIITIYLRIQCTTRPVRSTDRPLSTADILHTIKKKKNTITIYDTREIRKKDHNINVIINILLHCNSFIVCESVINIIIILL